MKRPRTVFGRVRFKLDGHEFFCEQRQDGLFLRQKHARPKNQFRRVAHADLHALAFGQTVFPI